MKLISWNVNGMRAVLGKGLLDIIDDMDADILCFQETKAQPEQLVDFDWPKGYEVFWHSAVKKGY
ncbi:MAG: hypothetical protein HN610_09465 [Verrucomicrobia bacterium]|nr:hypothetical protein [Verrucomicrobiota bacterium]